MRREDAGVNSPMGDGKSFNFQKGEKPDAEAERKLNRITTTHGRRYQDATRKASTENQGWCSCFSMCFGSTVEEEESSSTFTKAEPGPPPADFMTRVERPDSNSVRNKQPDSQGSAGTATSSREEDRSGLQSPRKEQTIGATLEMTDNSKRPNNSSAGSPATRSDKPDRSEIERFAFKDPNNTEPDPQGILKPNTTRFKKTLVLDLDETLVHSSFRPVDNPTFIIPVHIDNHVYNVYVLKRPYTDIFLERAAKCYEIIIFTASLAKYADPLLDELDKKCVINGRLFRDSCVMSGKTYVKDLGVLGRKLKNLIIVDNSPLSYQFQPKNAINCTSWFDDPDDTELLDMLPLLETTLMESDNVSTVLDADNMSYAQLVSRSKRNTNTGKEPMWGYSDGTGC